MCDDVRQSDNLLVIEITHLPPFVILYIKRLQLYINSLHLVVTRYLRLI